VACYQVLQSQREKERPTRLLTNLGHVIVAYLGRPVRTACVVVVIALVLWVNSQSDLCESGLEAAIREIEGRLRGSENICFDCLKKWENHRQKQYI
jgi:hypothetical protein